MAFSASASPDLRFAKVRGQRQKPERQAKKKAVKSRMDANKKAAKARDFKRCRWHEPHKCFGELASDHVEPLKMGGDPQGVRSETSNLFTCCAGVHKEFDESFHNGTIALDYIEPEKGCDGPCIGLRRFTNIDAQTGEKSYEWKAVWRESRVGVVLKGTGEC
jgi:hypothetical protein